MKKLLDAKGRLFGFINIIDLAVILLCVFFAVVAVRWAHVAEDPTPAKINMRYVPCVAFMAVPSYLAEQIKVGDEGLNNDGVVIARLDKIVSNNPYSVDVYSAKDGEKLYFNSDTREVIVRMSVLVYERKGDLFSCFTNALLRIGEGYTFTTKKYVTNVTIRKVLTPGA